MQGPFARTELLVGAEAMAKLESSAVAVFGLGGVGSYAVEGLARAGIGRLLLVDYDSVSITNINRQLPALHSSIGRPKAELLRERVLDINPRARVEALIERYEPGRAERFFGLGFDYVVDAIDSVSCKIDLIVSAKAAGLPIVSSMGAGNKLDPSRVEVADIFRTAICPLARVMRKELRKLGVEDLDVVYSREIPLDAGESADPGLYGERGDEGIARGVRRQVPGSISFVPPVFGFVLAGVVVRGLMGAGPPA
jgi:tRNA A37 threonylcarbamoyladenosine dehydratase